MAPSPSLIAVDLHLAFLNAVSNIMCSFRIVDAQITRYDVAHLLHMPSDSPALEHILAELPSDTDWDTSNHIERGYLKADLQRFSLVKIGTIVKAMSAQRKKETLTSASDTKNSSKAFNTGTSAPKPKIKVENESFLDMQNKAKVIKSAKGPFCGVYVLLAFAVLHDVFFFSHVRRTLGEGTWDQ